MLAEQQGTLNALASKCQAYSQQRSAGITPEAAGGGAASAGAAAEPGAGGLGATGSSGTTPIRTDSFSL